MMHFAILAFLVVCALGLFVWLCLPGARRRSLATIAFTVLTLGAFVAGVEAVGQPKPVALEWRDIMEAELVGFTWNEELRKVYLWLNFNGEPVAYVIPWPEDKKKMGQLQDKWRRRGASGDEFRFIGEGEVARVVPPAPPLEKEP